MNQLTAQKNTSLSGADVIVKAVHFFTSGRWRVQSQSEKMATFIGRPKIPLFLILLTLIGFFFLIIPGIIMYIIVIKKMIRLQNIVITTNPFSKSTEVDITYSKTAKKIVQKFLNMLPTV